MKYLLPALALLLCGCTSYQYEAIYNGTPHSVRKDADLVIAAAPAELRFRQVESRCVVMIDNRTKDPITLDGDGSAIVDPNGQTRGVATQLIPPNAFAKLILPPMADRPPGGPQWIFGLGVGAHVDAGAAPATKSAIIAPPSPGLRPPTYLVTSTEAMEYWEWDGPGEVRLVLSLKENDQTARHELILRRTKK